MSFGRLPAEHALNKAGSPAVTCDIRPDRGTPLRVCRAAGPKRELKVKHPKSSVRAALVPLLVALAASGCATPHHPTEQQMVSDRALVARVEAALQADRYTYAEHVKVDASHGIVRVSGQVRDGSDLRGVLRICAAVPGVERVDDQLEIIEFGRGAHR
jgi:hypothetical protein